MVIEKRVCSIYIYIYRPGVAAGSVDSLDAKI